MRIVPLWLWTLYFGCNPPESYPTIDINWAPASADLCGLDPAPMAALLGEWDDASPGRELAVVDLDGDGFAEVAYSVHAEDDYLTSGVRIHRGGPGGPEATPWVDAWGVASESLGSRLQPLADTDGDGRADLAVSISTLGTDTEGDQTITEVWSAVGTANPVPTGFVVDGGATLAGLDANGDGTGDLAVGDDGVVRLYLGGPGGLDPIPAATTENAANRFARDHLIGLGDTDGDGHGELLVADGSSRLYLVPGGGLDGPEVEIANVGYLVSLAGGDFDGDGLADWVAGWEPGGNGKVGWWPGGTSDAAPTREWTGANGDQRSFAGVVGDVNGDGDDELLIGARATTVGGAEYAGEVAVHPGDSVGPMENAAFTLMATGSRCFFGEQLEAGDVDGDGIPDLAARVSGDNEIAVGGDAVVVLKGDASWFE